MSSAGMVSIQSTVDTGHEDMIGNVMPDILEMIIENISHSQTSLCHRRRSPHDAQMDYYGKRLATCSSDKTVKIFEIVNNTQNLVATLVGHEGPVWQLSWAHPKFGNILASCSYDRKVIIWKESSGTWGKLYEFNEHRSSVNSIQWAPHEWGLILACASSDESFSIISTSGDGQWKYHRHENAHPLGCNAVSWAPAIYSGSLVEGGSRAPISSVKRLVTGGGDNLVKIWKEENDAWTQEEKLEAHTDWVRDVAWCPSVGLPITRIASCSQDCKVIIWTKDERTSGTWTSTVLSTFSDVVWHASWSITGDILAVSGGDNKVSLWKESLEGGWVCVSEVDKGQQIQQN